MHAWSIDFDKDAKTITQRIDHLSTNSAEQFGLFIWDKKLRTSVPILGKIFRSNLDYAKITNREQKP